jgi:hypothetical protein
MVPMVHGVHERRHRPGLAEMLSCTTLQPQGTDRTSRSARGHHASLPLTGGAGQTSLASLRLCIPLCENRVCPVPGVAGRGKGRRGSRSCRPPPPHRALAPYSATGCWFESPERLAPLTVLLAGGWRSSCRVAGWQLSDSRVHFLLLLSQLHLHTRGLTHTQAIH